MPSRKETGERVSEFEDTSTESKQSTPELRGLVQGQIKETRGFVTVKRLLFLIEFLFNPHIVSKSGKNHPIHIHSVQSICNRAVILK